MVVGFGNRHDGAVENTTHCNRLQHTVTHCNAMQRVFFQGCHEKENSDSRSGFAEACCQIKHAPSFETAISKASEVHGDRTYLDFLDEHKLAW